MTGYRKLGFFHTIQGEPFFYLPAETQTPTLAMTKFMIRFDQGRYPDLVKDEDG